MNILIVINGAITKIDGTLYKDNGTVNFFNEIAEQTVLTFWHEPINELNGMNNGLQGKKVPLNRIKIFINMVIKPHKYKLLNQIHKLYFFFLSVLKSLFSFHKIDFIYLYLPSRLSIINGYLAYLFKIPFGIYIRGVYPENNNAYTFLFKKAKFILVVGKYFKNNVLPYNANIHLVSPMINISENDLYIKKIHQKEIINVLFVGRVEKAKGILTLMKAAKKLFDKRNKIRINIVGGGNEIEPISQYIKNEKLEDYVYIHGLVSNKETLKQMYYDADIFVLPTEHEGFPRVLYEAMTYSVPVITTFVGSISSVMIDGYNCIEIPIGDSDEIVKAITLLSEDKNLRNKLSNNCFNTMKDFFESKSKYSHAEQVIRLSKGKEI